MGMTSRRGLAVLLSKLKLFSQPEMLLEQHPTDPDLAAELLWDAAIRHGLEEKRVVDLGAGTGMLALGAALLGAEVIAIEKDAAAVKVLQENAATMEGIALEVVTGDVRAWYGEADIVIMNPPFGTKERHADRLFLLKAFSIAPTIYTIHKTTTARFVRALAAEHGYTLLWEAERSLPVKQTMQHHKKEREQIAVTLFSFQKKP